MLPNVETTKPNIYMQYRKVEWLSEYRDIVSNYIQTAYYDYLKYYIKAMSLEIDTQAVIPLSQHYYGIPFIPAGSTSAMNKYDTGLLYDNGLFYDEGLDANVSVPYYYLYKYLKFILNYGEPCFNVDMIVTFLADFCEVDKNQIGISVDPMTITFNIPSNEQALILSQMISSLGGTLLGFPCGYNPVKIKLGTSA